MSLDNVEFADNPDPRCPCVLLLDTSSSMSGDPINQLNEGLRVFQTDIHGDSLAQRRVEIAVITFGNGGVQTKNDFVTAGNLQIQQLSSGGVTPMGEGIHRALDMLRTRKDQYQSAGIAYYRPWIFMITDGEPTDEWQSAAQRVHDDENSKGLAFFAVGVDNANMQVLQQIAVRQPLMLKGHNFKAMFLWLSASQQRISHSKVGDQTALPPPTGWAVV
jgi:uncharacterized protein YegL